MAAGYCYCLGIISNDFFLKDNKKAFILGLNVPKVTAYNFTSRTNFYICSIPTDMRKGREGLATIVREYFHRDPTAYGEAFIFYNKKYDTVKILHYDLNGYVIYQKWFDDGKMLKPKFMEIKSCHLITREQVTLLVSNAVQSKMYIYDE